MSSSVSVLFFNDTATTEIYTLSLHDALPISGFFLWSNAMSALRQLELADEVALVGAPIEWFKEYTARGETIAVWPVGQMARSEEHTSELQSRQYLVCRLLLEKKKKTI